MPLTSGLKARKALAWCLALCRPSLLTKLMSEDRRGHTHLKAVGDREVKSRYEKGNAIHSATLALTNSSKRVLLKFSKQRVLPADYETAKRSSVATLQLWIESYSLKKMRL